MSHKSLLLFFLAALSTACPVSATAAPPLPMQRQQIAAIAQSGVGFSYRWGGANWLPGSKEKGLCISKPGGNGCPACSHQGPWGMDCSGLVNTAWQLAGPLSTQTGKHPYGTWHLAHTTQHWQPLGTTPPQTGDAYVYNQGGKGHTFLVDSLDAWGHALAWECKGCATGCVHNIRDIPAPYKAIRRKGLQPDVPPPFPCPPAGTAKVCTGPAELATCASGSVVAISHCDWVGKWCQTKADGSGGCGE